MGNTVRTGGGWTIAQNEQDDLKHRSNVAGMKLSSTKCRDTHGGSERGHQSCKQEEEEGGSVPAPCEALVPSRTLQWPRLQEIPASGGEGAQSFTGNRTGCRHVVCN